MPLTGENKSRTGWKNRLKVVWHLNCSFPQSETEARGEKWRRKWKKGSQGLTLIELILSMAILAVLLAIASPSCSIFHRL
jgi:prepilin-type N-terminal cleavage/methylation domain-containing protein